MSLVNYDLVYHWRDLSKKPRYVVLDLDFTLWPFHIDYQTNEPFVKKDQVVTDSTDQILEHYPDVPSILYTLKNFCLDERDGQGKMAVASKALNGERAFKLIELFGWRDYFASVQIYSRDKNHHMYAIRNELKVKNFSDVLFLDDNRFNVKLTRQMGVVAYQLDKNTGLNFKSLHHALDIYEKKLEIYE